MSSKTSSKDAGAPTPTVPTENPASYDEKRFWRSTPWGDTYWCEMCSTCMRWRYSQRAQGRVCVTSFNFNFPLVIIERGRCNEYRPVPGAENLWADDYLEEEDEYDQPRDRDGGDGYDEEGGSRRAGGGSSGRRRQRRRPRRGGGGSGGGGTAPAQG